MIPQFDVELFAEIPCVSPEAGRILSFFPVALANRFRGRKNPRDHRKLRESLSFSEGPFEDLPGREVEFSDDLLVLFEKRVLSGSKAHQGLIPILPPAHLAMVGGTILDKFGDGPLDEFLRIVRKAIYPYGILLNLLVSSI